MESGNLGAGFMEQRTRWRICALVFFATTINYMDRQLLGVLKPVLDHQIGWSEKDFGAVVFAFQAAYAIGLTSAGWLLDRIGTRIGYAIATGAWSLAIMAHGLTTSVGGFMTARFALGLSEAGNYPAAVKTVAEVFPQRQRAFATGLFNAGSNVGAIVAPFLVPIILSHFSWRWAFYFAGIPGLIWLVLWFAFHSTSAPVGRALPAPSPVAFRELIKSRGAWAYALAKFLTDPVWWFFLFWLPDFLHTNYHVEVADFGLPLLVVYVLADLGSVVGGWSSSALIARGWSVDRARKLTMLGCACAALPVAIAPAVSGLWTTVLLISLAVAAHQAWSSNLLTIVSDLFPNQQAASVAGFGGTIGAIGGMLMALLVGTVLDATGSFRSIFWGASIAYITALLVIQLLVPSFDKWANRNIRHTT
ncbi:MFS transporter [Tsuneonella mangrovi]|uniref:MFS transporter n=1 Tax=Tsuneonella mangrovi TaxID=1982042 RepID=UPI000BA209EA|nr:MFS transporter [Tsuneonella mangrovi]